jgi:hypothetical protein
MLSGISKGRMSLEGTPTKTMQLELGRKARSGRRQRRRKAPSNSGRLKKNFNSEKQLSSTRYAHERKLFLIGRESPSPSPIPPCRGQRRASDATAGQPCDAFRRGVQCVLSFELVARRFLTANVGDLVQVRNAQTAWGFFLQQQRTNPRPNTATRAVFQPVRGDGYQANGLSSHQ